jgi:C4-dicarboxylate transporter, DcuC family
VTLAIAIFGIFAAMAVLMYLGRLPALIALPIMAVAIAVAARVPWRDIVTLLSTGSVKLSMAYTTAILGAVLAEIISRTGVAETMVKKAAELGGDRPRVLSLVLTAVVAVLFTTLGGLGAVIMVATIVFPVLLAVGVPQVAAAGLFLFGVSIGGILNLTNWQLYLQVLHLPQSTVFAFALPMVGIMIVAAVIFALVEIRPAKMRRFWATATEAEPKVTFAPWYSLLTPIVPLLPVLAFGVYGIALQKWPGAVTSALAHLGLHRPPAPFDFPIIVGMMIGIAYGLIATPRPPQGRVQLLARSAVEGVSAVAPAVVLMIGIGILVEAVMHPQVQAQVRPVLSLILPSSRLGYIVVFSLLAPLALYRGPLNLWGMGAGLAAMMAASPGLGAAAVMGALLSVGQIQGVCDPTNTWNVWIANYVGTDVQRILRRTIGYVWPAAVVGLALSALLFMRG